MRKLKLQMHISLDGFVSGPEGQLDWIVTIGSDQALGDFINAQLDSTDTMILGRKTAEVIVDVWEDIANNQQDSPEYPTAQRIVRMRKIAFSKQGSAIDGKNIEVENGDLVAVVQALKNGPGKDIIVYGGVQFVSELIRHDLIDEYHFLVNPVAIGHGLEIFSEKKSLKLENSVSYKNGLVVNSYNIG
ncbi:MAG TPA: dihydrofolate reductase family protein [Pedobacter sp.]|uniref:dihydrofolate reductase family protein n=1 Tax=Pedobacter sp. TaxID=1411316 RepID=UPI002C7088A8|nr:dihydrofolate reductase family protein [Pedobacter sp.]HMI04645.1 dihydrofolate reductase family protein [Pedobacter sp.]